MRKASIVKNLVLIVSLFVVVSFIPSCGSSSSDSQVSNESSQLLAPVISLSGTTLTWDSDEHATSYDIYANGSKSLNVSTSSIDVTSFITAFGNYQLQVMAIAQAGYTNSPLSNIVDYSYLESLDSPVIYQYKNYVRWSAIDGALKYEIYSNSNDQLLGETVSTSLELSFDESGTYPIYAIAKPSSSTRKESIKSNVLSFKYELLTLQSLLINLTNTFTNAWSLPYAYIDFSGEFLYYPMSQKSSEQFRYDFEAEPGTYHVNFFLATSISANDTLPATQNISGGHEFVVDTSSKSFEYSVSFASEPSEPTKYSDAYNGYYSSLTSWSDGENLKTQLNTLLNASSVKLVDFTSSDDKWNINKNADKALTTRDFVDLVYVSFNLTLNNTYSNGTGWQREHAFGQALGNFDVSNTRNDEQTVKVMRSDWHNLFASDNSANGSRNNMNLGNVSESMGVVKKCANSTQDLSLSEGTYVEGFPIFEPGDNDKGKLARAIFYMATRFSDLQIIEEPVSEVRKGQIGCLNDLLEWADNYYVSYLEYQHNSVVYSYQNNRNPFIDYPELVDYVFGDKKDIAVSNLQYLKPALSTLGGDSPTSHDHYAVETLYPALTNIKDKITYQVGETFSRDKFAIYDVKKDTTSSLYSGAIISSSPEIGHVFTSADIAQLTTVTLNIAGEEISYPISVVDADPTENVSYSHILSGTAQNADFAAYKDVTGPFTANVTLDGINFDVYVNSGKIGAKYDNGVAFGTGTAPCGTVSFVTTGFNNSGDLINKIFVKADIAGAQTPLVSIYLDDASTAIYSGTIVKNGTTAQNYGTILSNENIAPHKIKIEFTNLTAALRLYGLYINNAK